jgi:alpha-D-xyloside xylohydrolase
MERMVNGIRAQFGDGVLCLTVIETGIVRIQRGPQDAKFDGESLSVIDRAPRGTSWQASEIMGNYSVETGRMIVNVDKATGAIVIDDADGNVILAEPSTGGASWSPFPDKGGELLFSTTQRFQLQAGEAIYGLGQHFDGMSGTNYRGKTVDLYQRNTEVAVPVAVSSLGYAILWDNCSHTKVKMEGDVLEIWSEAGDCIDYYVIYGPGFDDIIKGIRSLTGRCPMMPKYIFGYIQSKERYKTGKELVSVVQEFKKRNIPIDVIVQDWRYWGSTLYWGQKSFNHKRFPDPTSTFKEIHDLDVRALISCWPLMTKITRNYRAFKNAHAFFLASDGVIGNAYDPYNPVARDIYWKQLHDGVLVHGLNGLWCDSPEPINLEVLLRAPKSRQELDEKNISYMKKQFRPASVSPAKYFLTYPLMHAKGIYEHWRATFPTRLVNLTRSGFTGQQRYSNFVWSGDISSRWDVLAAQVPAAVNFCLTGHPYWTMDIGGFWPIKFAPILMARGDFPQGIKDKGFQELYTRWFEMGAFCPMFRSHGTRTPREPWRFGEPGTIFYDTLLKYIHVRYRMLPYIYSLTWMVTDKDYTIIRHLAFDFPGDAAVHAIDDQYMFGPALMVCPVTKPMYFGRNSKLIKGVEKSRSVYLPVHEGGWYDFWTGDHFTGGQTIMVKCPIDIIPLFVPAGTILPLGPPRMHATEIPEDPIELRVYEGCDGQFELYEDENDLYNYENGQSSSIPVKWDDATKTIVIGTRMGEFPGMIEQRRFDIMVCDAERQRGYQSMAEGIPCDATIEYTGKEEVFTFS